MHIKCQGFSSIFEQWSDLRVFVFILYCSWSGDIKKIDSLLMFYFHPILVI